ncbi:MAG: hypothetical protein FWH48_02450 [Oscillospiraceae bacterium]|nr:hypothetical protein [Oscillospiraceae bacterium]
MMETNRWDGGELAAYIEGAKLCKGELTRYRPEPFVGSEAAKSSGHGGSDFYTTHFFIEKILGRPDGLKYSIDVYTAANMGICGILAYRSILCGNIPVSVPNLKNPEEREAYRNDHACTNPTVAGESLLPVSPYFDIDSIPDEDFEKCRQLWLDGKNAE